MTMERITRALIPGSFDPITIGHYDLAMRATRIFDEVYVVAFTNSSKHGRFSAEQRLEMLEAAFGGQERIKVDLSDRLLADYAAEHRITAIVKGARGAVDFDYELSMSLINRSLEPELDTIILPPRAEYLHVSSTMVSELIRYGKPFGKYLPAGVEDLVIKYTNH